MLGNYARDDINKANTYDILLLFNEPNGFGINIQFCTEKLKNRKENDKTKRYPGGQYRQAANWQKKDFDQFKFLKYGS